MSYFPPAPPENFSSSFEQEKGDEEPKFRFSTPYASNNIGPLLNPPHAPPPPHVPSWAEYYYKRLGEHHVPTRLPDTAYGEYEMKYKKFYDNQIATRVEKSSMLNFSNHANRGMLEIIAGLTACYFVPKFYRTAWRFANPTAPLPKRPPFKFFFGLGKYGGFMLLYSSYYMIFRTHWQLFPAPFGYDPEIPFRLDDRLGIEERNWHNPLVPGFLIYNIVHYKKLKAEIEESKKKISERKRLRALEFVYGTPAQKEAAAQPRPITPPLL